MEHVLAVLFLHIYPRETHRYPKGYTKKMYTAGLKLQTLRRSHSNLNDHQIGKG